MAPGGDAAVRRDARGPVGPGTAGATGRNPTAGTDVTRVRHRSWASCSSVIASAPVPSSAIEIGFGWSWLNGVSGLAVVTPESIGYSKLLLSAMICWPWAEVRKATNFWASAWCEEDLRIAGPRDVDDVPHVLGGEVGDGRMHVRRAEFGLLAVPVVLIDDAQSHLTPVDLIG